MIRERLGEINSEKRRLESALAELTGGKGGRGRGKRATSTSRGAGNARRVKPGERRQQVLTHLEKNPGARPSEIASAIKASPNQVHSVIAKLRKDRLVRKREKGYGLARGAESSSAKSPSNARGATPKASKARKGRREGAKT